MVQAALCAVPIAAARPAVAVGAGKAKRVGGGV